MGDADLLRVIAFLELLRLERVEEEEEEESESLELSDPELELEESLSLSLLLDDDLKFGRRRHASAFRRSFIKQERRLYSQSSLLLGRGFAFQFIRTLFLAFLQQLVRQSFPTSTEEIAMSSTSRIGLPDRFLYLTYLLLNSSGTSTLISPFAGFKSRAELLGLDR